MTAASKIAVLDYGMGNLRSVEKALAHVGADAVVTSDADAVRAAGAIVLPGVGAFPRAMAEIAALGLDAALRERVAAGMPVLGICLGMQLLFESSTELGGAAGLGLLAGRVERLPADGLHLPQIGWNPVRWVRGDPLVDGLENPTPLYHVHSYAAVPADPELALGLADYGAEFVTAVSRPPIWGVQFHPEKSGPVGLSLLDRFARVALGAAA